MKARSAVFVSLTRPTTVFGLPIQMFAAMAGLAFLAAMITVAFGFSSLMMPMLALVLGGGWWAAFRAARRDHHIDSVFRHAASFWGLRRRRWLLAGAHGPLPASVRRRRRPNRRRKGGMVA